MCLKGHKTEDTCGSKATSLMKLEFMIVPNLLQISERTLDVCATAFHLVPQNIASQTTGWLTRVQLPKPLQNLACKAFAGAFGLDLSEAKEPLTHFRSIEDLFTRELKPGVRPINGPVCSPADGYLARSLPVKDGEALQAKTLTYSVSELVLGKDSGSIADPSWFHTVYLAPHNYHRVHSPFAGKVTAIRHLPGELWPVNVPFVNRVPRLFARNERLVFDYELEGGGKAWVVMVGAFNVGRMITPLAPELVTNDGHSSMRTKVLPGGHLVGIGEEIGTFMLGSTVIIVYDSKAHARFKFTERNEPASIKMGEPLTLEHT